MDIDKTIENIKQQLKEVKRKKRDSDYSYSNGHISKEENDEINYTKELLEIRLEGYESIRKGNDKDMMIKIVNNTIKNLKKDYRRE